MLFRREQMILDREATRSQRRQAMLEDEQLAESSVRLSLAAWDFCLNSAFKGLLA